MALLITYASARPPSEDTPIDQIVSCVYPMSGQYGFLPRLLFYCCLILASTTRRSGWFTSIVLGLAMSYSATAFVHFIVIYATHGGNPPILDLDLLSLDLLAAVSVSMCPALCVLHYQRYMSLAVKVVVQCWWFIMFFLDILVRLLLNNLNNLQYNNNSEVACYLPDNTLLTSLAQLNGTRDLECIYDCFLTRKSVLRTQDAVTVMWGNPTNSKMGQRGLTTGNSFLSLMVVLWFHMQTYPRTLKRLRALLFKPVYSVYNKDKQAILTPMACICLITMAPWVIKIEYSLWSTPVEEMSFAIGQWGPWVALLFSIIGGAVYRVLEEPKDGEQTPEPGVNTQVDYVMSGALVKSSDNIPMDSLTRLGRGDDTHLLGDVEIDIGVYNITPEPEL